MGRSRLRNGTYSEPISDSQAPALEAVARVRFRVRALGVGHSNLSQMCFPGFTELRGRSELADGLGGGCLGLSALVLAIVSIKRKISRP